MAEDPTPSTAPGWRARLDRFREGQGTSEQTAWKSRGYHPHFHQDHFVQALTFRLADSLPDSVLERWAQDLKTEPDVKRAASLLKRMAAYLDAGHGACWMKLPEIAQIVENALLHYDHQRYRLICWCVMPNHVHVMLECIPPHELAMIVKAWKGYTARLANRILQRTGPFWQKDYHDRYIRDEKHFSAAMDYIHRNPVKAHLSVDVISYPFNSARHQLPS